MEYIYAAMILHSADKDINEEELKEVCAGVDIWDIAVKLKEKFGNHDQDSLNW